MQVSVTRKAHWGHTLIAVRLGPGLTEVVEFGGSPDPLTGSDVTQPIMADTTLLEFSECPRNLHTCMRSIPVCIECKPVVCKKVPVGVVWAKVLAVFRAKYVIHQHLIIMPRVLHCVYTPTL